MTMCGMNCRIREAYVSCITSRNCWYIIIIIIIIIINYSKNKYQTSYGTLLAWFAQQQKIKPTWLLSRM
jgi:hypothetical protein